MHRLAPTKSVGKALGLEQVVRRCMNVEADERPSSSQVREMLGKLFRVEVLIQNAKRFVSALVDLLLVDVELRFDDRVASRAARALPFWHGRNVFIPRD